MRRGLTADHLRAIEQDRKRGLFLRLDHPDGIVYVWSGTGSLNILDPIPPEEGEERPAMVVWHGVGGLGTFEGIDSAVRNKINTVTLQLANIPLEAIGHVNSNVRERPFNIYIGFLDDHDMLIGTLLPIQSGEMEFQSSGFEPGRGAALNIEGISGIVELATPADLKWSTAQQQADYPGGTDPLSGFPLGDADTGMDEIPNLKDKNLIWEEGSRRA